MTDQQLFPPQATSIQDPPVPQPLADDQSMSLPQDSSAPASDQNVDELVQSAADIQQQLSQPAPADDPSAPSSVPSTGTGDANKSPLDILEELLGKDDGNKAANEPPKPTPEEIATARREAEDQQAKELEIQRQEMLAEIDTDEQKKRDEVRHQQISSLQTNSEYHIPQLKRTTIQVPEEKTATKS